MPLQILRSESLQTIPPRKVVNTLERTLRKCENCSKNNTKLNNACERCRNINAAYKRYAESNIPIRYWDLRMKSFQGTSILTDTYNEIVKDLRATYDEGVCICLAGSHGVGKTMSITNILKRAVESGYSSLYTTLGDIVSNATSNHSDKFVARKELMMVDFLAIDEFDPRHMSGDASADLFGRLLEDVFRRRSENKMPIFMCTNSPNVVESFSGPIKDSIDSLMSYAKIIPVLGRDFRKGDK